mgnify:FL=1
MLLVSVPHTGTRFLQGLTNAPFMHSYEYTTPQNIVDRGGSDILCAPLRDPWEVWKTWYQRYPNLFYILDPDHPKSMETAWRSLAALDREFGSVIYIPVDVPDRRDEQLQSLSEAMGRDLSTDWEPVAARTQEKKLREVPEKDLSWIYQLPFVEEFYGGKAQASGKVEEDLDFLAAIV